MTHADAISAAVQMFGHGNIDVQQVDFCARVTANRAVQLSRQQGRRGSISDMTFGQKWDVNISGITHEVMQSDSGGSMEKLYVKQHRENVAEVAGAADKRSMMRTKTDHDFSKHLLDLAASLDVEDGEGDGENERDSPKLLEEIVDEKIERQNTDSDSVDQSLLVPQEPHVARVRRCNTARLPVAAGFPKGPKDYRV